MSFVSALILILLSFLEPRETVPDVFSCFVKIVQYLFSFLDVSDCLEDDPGISIAQLPHFGD